jgi:hypothetical protein
MTGQAGASAFAAGKDRFRHWLNIGFCPLTVGSLIAFGRREINRQMSFLPAVQPQKGAGSSVEPGCQAKRTLFPLSPNDPNDNRPPFP